MAFPPTTYGLIAIKYQMTGRSTPYVCTHGFYDDATKTPAAIATQIVNAWVSGFTAAKCNNMFTLQGGHVLINRGGNFLSGDDTRSTVGTVAAAPAPPQVCVLVHKSTLYAGVRNRGRMYLSGAFTNEANIDQAGIIDGATLASLQTSATTALTAFNATTTPAALLHRDGSPGEGIIAWTIQPKVGTQRRRLR